MTGESFCSLSLCHGPKPATIESFSCKYYKIPARIAMSRAALVRPVWRLGFARSCHDGQCFHRPMATATPARIAVIRSTSQRGGWAGDSFHQGISYRLLQSQSQCGSNMRLHLVPKSHFEKKLSRKSWTQGLRCCGKHMPSRLSAMNCHMIHLIGFHGDALLGMELVPALRVRNRAH